MQLKDEADVAPGHDQLAAAELRKIMTEHFDSALLNRAQGSDQGQQGRLPRPRGPRHDHELSGADFDLVAEQHLAARLAVTIVMVERLDANHWQWRGHTCGVERRCCASDHDRTHQNTSAGSAAMTLRTARIADIRHMPRVSPKLIRVSSAVIRRSRSAASPTTR